MVTFVVNQIFDKFNKSTGSCNQSIAPSRHDQRQVSRVHGRRVKLMSNFRKIFITDVVGPIIVFFCQMGLGFVGGVKNNPPSLIRRTKIDLLQKREAAIRTLSHRECGHLRHENFEKFEMISTSTGSWIRSRRRRDRIQLPIRRRNHLVFFQNFHEHRDGTVRTLDGTQYKKRQHCTWSRGGVARY